MKCIACKTTLVKFDGQILKCPNCGLGVTQKNQTQDYSRYHRDDTYIKEDKQFKNIFSKRVKTILKIKKEGSALEIGSSTGLLLSLLKEKGWEVQGIEPSKEAASYAIKKGIPTLVTTFEKAKLKKAYDLIILNHVLEHVDDPEKFLKKAHQLLRHKGIVFIDVPHFGSLSAKRKGSSWEYLLPDEHKWHFTEKSFKFLFKKTKFHYVHGETHSGIWGYGNPFLELSQSLVGLKKRFFRNSLTAFPSYIVSRMGLGTGLTIIGEKK